MKNYNIFSYKTVLIFSLLLTESFFFTLRIPVSMIEDRGMSYIALNRFTIPEIIISLISLFIFVFIFISIFFFLIKKLNFKLNNFFLLLLFAFISANSIKTLFDYSDYSWHYVGIRNIYPLLLNSFIKPYFSILWYLSIYILSLILVYILRNKFEKIIKFLFSYSIVFFIIMFFQIFSLINIHKNLNSGEIKSININEKSDRKVLWIFFDGFDPELAFSNNENTYQMTNFEKLFKNSVTHHKFYAPAKDTLYSFASMLIGKDIKDASFSNHRMNLVSNNKEVIPLDFENTIFGRLFNDGYDSSITGYGFHPFCLMISYVKCKVFNEPLKWYDGILNIIQYNRFKAHYLKQGNHRDINPYIIKSMFDYIRSEKPTNLLFVHNRVPHLCHKCTDGLAGMAEKYFDYKFRKKSNPLNLVSDRKEAYFINLKFIDSLIGEIFDEIDNNKNYKQNKTLIILTSDHWAKDYYGDFKNRPTNDNNTPYPALFVAKIIGDDEKYDIYNPDSGIHVQELIHSFLNKTISSHSDIDEFFSKKNGYNVLMNIEMKFSVEKDF